MSLLAPRNRLFDDVFNELASGFYVRPLHGDGLPAQIKLDVKETATSYVVSAELPGVSREDIHVEIHGSRVAIKAEIKQHDANKDDKVLRSERYYGSVSRTFELPVELDEQAASAKFDNGVLNLQLPKKQKSAGAQKLRIE